MAPKIYSEGISTMAAPTEPIIHSIPKWLEENEKYFLPPVCNKMIHQTGQMKSFFVGGPNQRKDYHIDCGEELFYMLKGDMVLKVVERGIHKDIHIKEGEIFLLPGYVHHSPQRFANTVGLVLERDRHITELDGLRYFVEKDGKPTTEPLYEKYFHCEDLGSQLKPVIEGFFASEQYATGKPLPGTIADVCPIDLDEDVVLQPPFHFQNWINENRSDIDGQGSMRLYNSNHQFQVFVYGKGENIDQNDIAETWIWQWEGSSDIEVNNVQYKLKTNENMLVPAGQRFRVKQLEGSLAFVAYQDPRSCKSWPKSN